MVTGSMNTNFSSFISRDSQVKGPDTHEVLSLHEEFGESTKENMGAAGVWKRCLEMLGQNRGVLGMPARVPVRTGSLQSTEVPRSSCVLGRPLCLLCRERLAGYKLSRKPRGRESNTPESKLSRGPQGQLGGGLEVSGAGRGRGDGRAVHAHHHTSARAAGHPASSLHQEESRSRLGCSR